MAVTLIKFMHLWYNSSHPEYTWTFKGTKYMRVRNIQATVSWDLNLNQQTEPPSLWPGSLKFITYLARLPNEHVHRVYQAFLKTFQSTLVLLFWNNILFRVIKTFDKYFTTLYHLKSFKIVGLILTQFRGSTNYYCSVPLPPR